MTERKVHCIAFAHEHLAEVGNVAGRTDRKGAAITVITMRCAGDAALGHKLGKPRLGRPIAAAMDRMPRISKRPGQKTFTRRIAEGPPAQPAPAQLMDSAHCQKGRALRLQNGWPESSYL